MILQDFDYERPRTLEEASALLRELGPGASLIAGGTDLLPNMRAGIATPRTLVSLRGIAPHQPRHDADGSVRIDALTRLIDVQNSELLRGTIPVLTRCARTVASNQIRQTATVGGNLCQQTRCLYLNQKHDYQFAAPCHKRGGDCCYSYPTNPPDTCLSMFMSDMAPVLIALRAEVEVVGTDGIRRRPLEEMFTGSGLKPLALGQADIVRAVIVPPPPKARRVGYHKSTRRGGLEFGMAVIAAALELGDDSRTCTSARIVVGAVRERPVRAVAAEKALVGTLLDDLAIADAAGAAAREVDPLPHHGFTKNYLRENIHIHLRRVMSDAVFGARA